ncbi:hypothetical protein G9A89_015247 [Geosiphon pyriformis]|nr:hypothetical protein G9A89_015247 [Geosiphon pyriformis]
MNVLNKHGLGISSPKSIYEMDTQLKQQLLPQLPFDCIHEIFSQLINDLPTLLSCTRVSRAWCLAASPFLWQEPFRDFKIKALEKLKRSQKNLIEIFFHFLTHEQRERLSQHFSASIFEQSIFEMPPSLPYPRYTRRINILWVNGALKHWLEAKNLFYFPWDGHVMKLLEELGKVFIQQASSIREFTLAVGSIMPYPPNFFKTSFATQYSNRLNLSLAKLRILRCRGLYHKAQLFDDAASALKDLTEIEISKIWHSDEWDALGKLVRAQRKLENFKIRDCNGPGINSFLDVIARENDEIGNFRSIGFTNSIRTITNMGKACSNIRYLEFSDVNFSPNAFVRFLCLLPNLETLLFHNCDNSSPNETVPKFHEQSHVLCRKLRRLVFRDSSIETDQLVQILKNAGRGLQEFKVYGLCTANVNIILNCITENCSNIEVFGMGINVIHFPALIEMLNSCRRLKQVSFDHNIYMHDTNLRAMNVEEFMLPLAAALPETLQELNVWSNWVFTTEAFKEFFEKLKSPLQLLNIGYCKCINDRHLEIITIFAKVKGTLSTLDIRDGKVSSMALQHAKKVIKHVIHSQNPTLYFYMKPGNLSIYFSRNISINATFTQAPSIASAISLFAARIKNYAPEKQQPKFISQEEAYGQCPKCQKTKLDYIWCHSCLTPLKNLNWNSGNPEINAFIQSTQKNPVWQMNNYLEWIPYGRLTDIEFLGAGGQSTAFLANWRDGEKKTLYNENRKWLHKTKIPKRVVLKNLLSQKNTFKLFLTQVDRHYRLVSNRCNLLQFFGITQNPKTLEYLLVTEYGERGNLGNYLREKRENLEWVEKMRIVMDIATDLDTIHRSPESEEYPALHGNIHPGNVLIKENYFHLADYGLNLPHRVTKTKKGGKKGSVKGVLPYLAPELLCGEPYSQLADIYSFGILMAEIASGEPPLSQEPHNENLADKICQGMRPQIPFDTPDRIKKIIEKCWNANPEKRMKPRDLYTAVFLTYEKMKDEDGIIKEMFKHVEKKDKALNSDEKNSSCLSKGKLVSETKTNYKDVHPKAIYISREFSFKKLPTPVNLKRWETLSIGGSPDLKKTA